MPSRLFRSVPCLARPLAHTEPVLRLLRATADPARAGGQKRRGFRLASLVEPAEGGRPRFPENKKRHLRLPATVAVVGREDRATLESDLSALAGGCTEGQNQSVLPPLSSAPPGAPKAINSGGQGPPPFLPAPPSQVHKKMLDTQYCLIVGAATPPFHSTTRPALLAR
jgi:hypothetical protein